MRSVSAISIFLLIQCNLLTAFTTASLAQTPAFVVAETNLIVRLYYGDRARLNQLVSQYDVFEYADHDAGYVAARLSRDDFDKLIASGYRVEVDSEQTSLANRSLINAVGQFAGIPSYPCYRTVEETYATLMQITNAYPGLASLVDVGDSWEKVMPGGAAGYDLLALMLSNKSKPGPKPRFLLVAEFHARELTTSETATRFAEELVAGYGVDPDVTWMLDYFEVHIIPMANPDGRKKAELGQLWRKNTDSDDGCASSFGTDMNRNFGFKWGMTGSSASPCDETYRGTATFSAPESQAIRDYIASLLPDQRGSSDTDIAPTNTTGLVVSLHSYGRLVLYSWGWTTTPAPNATALKTLGGKFGYFNRYTVQPTIQLYAVSGELNDWVYGELGVPGYTIEMGTTFFESCTTFQNTIYPSNRPALFYAFKACRQPYLSPAGPDVLQATITTATNTPGTWVNLSANAVSGRSFGYAPLPAATNITAARYSVDIPSWVTGAVTQSMSATDGSFNSTNETVAATINTTGLSVGRHTVFIEARTGANTWGLPSAVFIDVPPPTIVASLAANQIVLKWPSTPDAFYTLLQSSNLLSPFSIIASNILATAPTNTFTYPISKIGSQFYKLKLQP